jgi:hypothetical protein
VHIEGSPARPAFDLAQFWRDIEAVPPPMPTWPRAAVGSPAAPPIPEDEMAWYGPR